MHEITRFSDASSSWAVAPESQPDSTYSVGETPETIDGFLNRPLLISSFEWAVNESLDISLNPWSLFYENNQVLRRMANFKLLRSKLHVRFLVNGNQFYYGRALASYRPIHTRDLSYRYSDQTTADIIEMSQRPSVMLDPTDSTGAMMDLPFFWMNNALNIPKREWEEMGIINLVDMVPLRHANGSTDSITISVFAWATDVNLSQPTSKVPVNQSEFDGPISGPASKVARAAGYLKNAPLIGSYAKATEIGAGALAGLAKTFGFSKPPITDHYTIVADRPQQGTTTANMRTAPMPLSLDVKKEVTIDPRTTGLSGTDELEFKYLAQRNSFLNVFNWEPSSVSGELLYNYRVTPLLHQRDENQNIHMLPMGFAALPFQYWRGTLIYSFDVVASQYHKGRLRITFDPEYQATNETNVNRQVIVDISNTKNIQICVGWGQGTTYLQVGEFFVDGEHQKTVYSFPKSNCNGVLSVFVLNQLTTPSDSIDPISIISHVRAGEDFEVAGPTDKIAQNYTLLPLSAPIEEFPPIRTFTGSQLITQGGTPSTENVWTAYTTPYQAEPYRRMSMLNASTGNTSTAVVNVFSFPYEKFAGNAGEKDFTVTIIMVNPSAEIAQVAVTDGTRSRELFVPAQDTLRFTFTGVLTFDGVAGIVGKSFSVTLQTVTIPIIAPYVEIESFSTHLSTRYDCRSIHAYTPDEYEIVAPGIAQDNAFHIPTGGSVIFKPKGTPLDIYPFETEMLFDGVSRNGTATTPGNSIAFNTPIYSESVLGARLVANDSGEAQIAYVTTGTETVVISRANVWVDTLVNQSQVENQSDVMEDIMEEVGDTNMPADPNLIFFGEEIPSFRTLLKRPETVCTTNWDVANIDTRQLQTLAAPTVGMPEQSIAVYNELTILEYVRRAFLGERGSIRFSVTTAGSDLSTRENMVSITRYLDYNGLVSTATGTIGNYQTHVRYSLLGTAVARLTSLMEFDVPWYSMYRFSPTRLGDFVTDHELYLERQAFKYSTHGSAHENALARSIGEDYNVFFFMNTPILVES